MITMLYPMCMIRFKYKESFCNLQVCSELNILNQKIKIILLKILVDISILYVWFFNILDC